MSGFWLDPDVRHALFKTLSDSSTRDSEAEDCLHQIDDEIVSGLLDFGIPRGEVNGIQIDDGINQWLGRKDPTCLLYISRLQMGFYLSIGEPDAIVSTWAHESIHARQPYTDSIEYSVWTGYEEGMAEGLTQRFLSSRGIVDVDVSFPFYVTAYEEIAVFLGIDVEALWRGLWHYPAGMIRSSFIDAINLALVQSGRDRLTERRRDRLQLATDTLLATRHRSDEPDRRSISNLLRRIVQ